MNPLVEVRRSKVFSLIQKAAAYNFEYKNGVFTSEIDVKTDSNTDETGEIFESLQDYIKHNERVDKGSNWQTWEEYKARPYSIYCWEDPPRPRLKTGEGHWSSEWGAIAAYTEPTYPGTEVGEWSDNGYFI